MTDVAGRLRAVRERIAGAVARRGPGPDVTLVGVAKRQPIERVRAALGAGLADVGENYAQALRDRIAELGSDPPRWHFIGALQSNKLKYVVGKALIQTVDRPQILAGIERRAAAAECTQEVLVEVNVAGEHTKAGVDPSEVASLLDAFGALEHVRCTGLMAIPPARDARTHFRALRELRDRLAETQRPGVDLAHLSMGMSADFEDAIAEGATIVRVGTAIFGARD